MNIRRILRIAVGAVSAVIALFAWLAYILLHIDAGLSYHIANEPHGPADANGLVGVFGLFLDVFSMMALIAAIGFTIVAAALFWKRK